jgi:DNA adenine methylase Dam
MIKTPLRYAGGKSKAVNKLNTYLPNLNSYEYREPFLGGGSLALFLSQQYQLNSVWVNDLNKPLYNFWITLRDKPTDLHNDLVKIKLDCGNDIDKHKHYYNTAKQIIQNNSPTQDIYDSAINYYILNKCSFSGLGDTGFSKSASIHKNFNIKNIGNLLKVSPLIKNWKITNLPYEDLLIPSTNNTFIYLDPPYSLGKNINLYGNKRGNLHKQFNHNDFYTNISSITDINTKWLVSYNSSEEIKNKWIQYYQEEFDLTYSLRTDKESYNNKPTSRTKNELVISNYEYLTERTEIPLETPQMF